MSKMLDDQPPVRKRPLPWKVILPIVIVTLLLAASIILPTLNRLRQGSSNTTPAIRHLHQIGLGILLYTQDFGGQFPNSLANMVAYQNMSSEVLIDPETDDTPAEGSTTQRIVAEVAKGGHQTFIYLGAGLTAKTADACILVAYEPLSVYQNGTNALFGDGHGEWLTPEGLRKNLARRAAMTSQPTTTP